MDFGEAFSFQRRDPEWIKKVLFAGLFAMLGVTVPAVNGWMMEIFRRQARGKQDLPNILDDFGKYFMDGLKAIGVAFVWLLPAVLIYGCGITAQIIAAQNPDYETVGMVALVVSLCIVLPWFFAVGLLSGPMTAILTQTGSFGMALNPMKSLALLRKNAGGFIIGGLVGGIISSLLALVGMLACGLGVIVAQPYGIAGTAHLLNQAYQKAGGDEALRQL